MSITQSDRLLADRLADYVVLAHDPTVATIAADYWAKSESLYRRVDERLRVAVSHDGDAAQAYAALAASPAGSAPHAILVDRLMRLLPDNRDLAEELRVLLEGADREVWIDYHLGDAYRPTSPCVRLSELVGLVGGTVFNRSRTVGGIHVIIPFRDRQVGARTRNLLACLLALRDQDLPADQLSVTVVEADDRPRCESLLEGLVDQYLFAPKADLFNKSWTVNVGLTSVGKGYPITCVLDADIITDRRFLTRNRTRMSEHDHGAHLPFRWSLSLDAPSTDRAIFTRLTEGRPEIALNLLRGLLLREAPGGCLWVRTEAFHDIGGFDERYEGWGGEDDDVVARLERVGGVARFDDTLLHLDHPRPPMTVDGRPFNADIEPLSWWGAEGFGDVRKFSG